MLALSPGLFHPVNNNFLPRPIHGSKNVSLLIFIAGRVRYRFHVKIFWIFWSLETFKSVAAMTVLHFTSIMTELPINDFL